MVSARVPSQSKISPAVPGGGVQIGGSGRALIPSAVQPAEGDNNPTSRVGLRNTGDQPMSTATAPKLMTVEEFLALPEDGVERWLIRGQLRESRPEQEGEGMTKRNRIHS